MKIIIIRILLIAGINLLSVGGVLHAQTIDNVKIGFKDYHTEEISNIILSNDKKFILTSDQSGKILKYDANTFDFLQTVREPSGEWIRGFRLFKKDTLLFIDRFFNDSIVAMNLNSSQEKKVPLSIKFADIIEENVEGIISSNKGTTKFELLDNDLNLIGSIPLNLMAHFTGKNCQISADYKKFAYEQTVSGESSIYLFDFETKQEIKKIVIPTNLSVNYLFFEKEENNLFAIVIPKNESKLHVYNLSENGFTQPVFTTDYFGYDFAKVIARHVNGSYIFTLISQHAPPLVLIKNKINYELQKVDLGNLLNHSNPKTASINTENKTIYYTNDNAISNKIASISVYDYAQKKVIKTFPQTVNGFFESVFLPNGSWLAYPSSYVSEFSKHAIDLTIAGTLKETMYESKDLKYFEAGTFKNRFHSLNLFSYLEANHGIESSVIKLFPKQGFATISASTSNGGDHSFFLYDLLKDQVQTITNKATVGYYGVEDYVPRLNLLLLSKWGISTYTDRMMKLELIKGDEKIPLKGNYEYGKLSKDGNFLLTINENHLLEIRKAEGLAVLHSQNLEEGKYSVFSIDESSFILSNDYLQKDMNKCNRTSFTFNIEDEIVTAKELECILFKDVDESNGNVAMIVDNLGLLLTIVDDEGLLLKQKTIPFSFYETPQSVSFNSDGSKFILNQKDGKNVIYNSKSFKPIGYVIHPDYKSHVFSDTNNHFFSNINAEQFLYAQKNGSIISLKQVENDLFNPEAILRLFSEPNPYYLKALNQANEIRKEYLLKEADIHYNTSDISTVSITEKNEKKKPNLYFLSIGVAHYEDEAYRLRFPGKDALEMAQIYGQLAPEKLAEYDDKFKGKRYTIYNQNREISWEYLKYLGPYPRGVNKSKAIAQDGSIWLEWFSDDEFIVWDFKNMTQDTIQIKGVGGAWSSVDDIIPYPDNSGFIIKGDKLQKYELRAKKITDVAFPLNLNENNFVPLFNNQWLQMDHTDTSIIVLKGKIADTALTNKRIIPLKFTEDNSLICREILGDKQYKMCEIYFWNFGYFKKASANGRYLFFTSLDLNQNLFYLDLDEKDPIPIRLPINLSYGDEVSIDSKGSQFYVVHKNYDLKRTEINYYNFWGEPIKSINLSDVDNLSIINDGFNFFYFKEEKNELAKWNEERNTLLDQDEVLKNGSPFSFDKVFVETLIDEQASSKNIKEKLQTFFNNAEEQDQIMVFLAGHGLLSKTNDFYFAPVDMDFSNVTQKGISFETLIKSLQNSKSKNKLLLIDACQSGKTIDLGNEASNFTNVIQEDKRGAKVIMNKTPKFKVSEVISTLFSDFLSKSGVSVFSAASGSDLAQEKLQWGNGAFTHSYINVLKKHLTSHGIFLDEEKLKTSILLNDVFIDDLNFEVIKTTKGEQIPDLRELNKNAIIRLW